MEKLISIVMVIVLVLALSGCEEETAQQVYYNYAFEGKLMIGCSDTTGDTNVCDSYIEIYTQEEVDLLLQEQAREIMELLYDNYVEYNEFDEVLYSNCEIVDGIKHCDIVININELEGE
jgi:uncharacterized lipoprotein YehR (DUF1307 family)